VIFGVGGTDGEHRECQSEEFAERETRDYMSSGVGDAVGGFVVWSSCLFAGEMAGIGDVEQDSEAFDGFVGRDIGQV
jgi:hypothetical protein